MSSLMHRPCLIYTIITTILSLFNGGINERYYYSRCQGKKVVKSTKTHTHTRTLMHHLPPSALWQEVRGKLNKWEGPPLLLRFFFVFFFLCSSFLDGPELELEVEEATSQPTNHLSRRLCAIIILVLLCLFVRELSSLFHTQSHSLIGDY